MHYFPLFQYKTQRMPPEIQKTQSDHLRVSKENLEDVNYIDVQFESVILSSWEIRAAAEI